MILIGCARWIDADPGIIVVRGVVEFEADGFTRHGFQHLNRFT